jgi:hypothetical protein
MGLFRKLESTGRRKEVDKSAREESMFKEKTRKFAKRTKMDQP